MIRTFYASVRSPLLAPIAALIFSGCSGADAPDASDTDSAPSSTAPSSTAPSSTTPASSAPANAAPSDSAPADTTPAASSPDDAAGVIPPGTDAPGSAAEPSEDEGDPDTDTVPAGGEQMPSPDVDMELVQAGAPAISLGAAESFSLLASATVTCTNSSAVTGDVGVSPGIAITGFDASCTLEGSLHAQDADAAAAHADLLVAFDQLGAAECETDLTGVELGGLTLAPGVYCFDTTAGVTGALTLDAGPDPSASWIFQVGSAITTAPGSTVTMTGGGDACNVFWRVGSSAVLGTSSAFVGNILASASVTLASSSSLEGRALALNAAVTSDNNVVSGCVR
jgi:hypothetical protein